MSRENVDVIRGIYEAWAEGRSARDFIDQDVEYINPSYAVEPGTIRGRKAFSRVRDAYPEFKVEPARYVDAGDDVVVIGIARGRGASGLETQWEQGYVWTVRDGVAVRFRWFNTPGEALEAVGLPE